VEYASGSSSLDVPDGGDFVLFHGNLTGLCAGNMFNKARNL
jgi:hypothetical protein